ncbi:MAG: sugar transporter ATP-binding protein [Acidimicrobiaceae bacterium]|nr:sugar transporter ATP-binding protein [Acidimicrobiaceae bacterium]
MTSEELILEVRSIQKNFGGVVALSNCNFSLRPNEVHAIVGDNGAGKSTLLKIIAGALQPDGGELLVDGQVVSFTSPKATREYGIATVWQELALIDHLDATANLFLGRELYRPFPLSLLGVLDKRAMRSQASEQIRRLKVNVKSVDQQLLGMSGGQRQAIAIARALTFGSRMIIMDEPTAALGVRESAAVLESVREVRRAGRAVIMISHNLQDVFAVADRVTALRLGRTVATVEVAETTAEEVVSMMTGAYVTN